MHCFRLNRTLSVPWCKFIYFLGVLRYLPDQTLLLLFRACQLWLNRASGMNRRRMGSLPSLLLTAPRNHPPRYPISPLTDWLLVAFPDLIWFPFLIGVRLLVVWCCVRVHQSGRLCQCNERCMKDMPAGWRPIFLVCSLLFSFIPSELIRGDVSLAQFGILQCFFERLILNGLVSWQHSLLCNDQTGIT